MPICLIADAQSAGTEETGGFPDDGTLLESSACPPLRISYDVALAHTLASYQRELATAAAEAMQRKLRPVEDYQTMLPIQAEFEKRRADDAFECLQIVYASDGLRIAGFIWKPKHTNER